MVTKIALALAALLLATVAHAEPAPTPSGAVQFCLRNASFCDPHPSADAPQSAMATLSRVNLEVNAQILPQKLETSDEKRAENANWRVVTPGAVGGCVEYAVTKMARLSWVIPMGAMRLAQVRVPETGELHMVLLVRVNGVVAVLDNRTPVIWGPAESHYQFLAVQNGWKWETPDGLK